MNCKNGDRPRTRISGESVGVFQRCLRTRTVLAEDSTGVADEDLRCPSQVYISREAFNFLIKSWIGTWTKEN